MTEVQKLLLLDPNYLYDMDIDTLPIFSVYSARKALKEDGRCLHGALAMMKGGQLTIDDFASEEGGVPEGDTVRCACGTLFDRQAYARLTKFCGHCEYLNANGESGPCKFCVAYGCIECPDDEYDETEEEEEEAMDYDE